LNLPHEDGISLCKWLRGIYPQMGIVMLTARVMGSDRTEGYEAGADVYLTKPTRPAELLAVMRNLVKRARGSESPTQKEGSYGTSWMLNVASMNLIGPSHEILSLTPKEVKVLGILAQSPAAQSYQDILERVQTGEAVVQDKAKLEVLISRLRQKLSRLHNHEFEIKTVHGTGYQLLTPVQVIGR
jgi:DNA-binding response OmpR family regulator